jgi:Pathogenicity locus
VVTRLEDLPNIGPSIANSLRRVGVYHPSDLVGQRPEELYRALGEATGVRHDPCVLDVFISAVRFVEGEPARPWWYYTAERKQRYAAVTAAEPADPQAVRAISSTRPDPPFHAR